MPAKRMGTLIYSDTCRQAPANEDMAASLKSRCQLSWYMKKIGPVGTILEEAYNRGDFIDGTIYSHWHELCRVPGEG